MFTSFNQGEDHPAHWDEPTAAYGRGRFHAHARPTSPPLPSGSRASSVHNLPFASSPSGGGPLGTGSSSEAHERQRSRARPLGRALLALSGTKKRQLREEEERAALLSGWTGGGVGGASHTALQAALGVTAEEQEEDEDEGDRGFLRPGRKRVERWMGTWWRRWAVLVGAPCCLIWVWCSVPFPAQDSSKEGLPALLAQASMPRILTALAPELPIDTFWWFFLLWYYGVHIAIALGFVSKLFDLYRLNWWPSSLGGGASYAFFWALSLSVGFALHHFDLDGFGRRTRSHRPDGEEWDWERKTTWVLLAFATMALPALACFAKLRADRRNSYRRSLTPAQKTFLDWQLAQRMPRSYRRFLWFLAVQALALVALILGQGFATVYLSTLPHNNVEGLFYVWTWILTVQLLNAVSNWILMRKVRSQALVFVFKYYFAMLYGVFYRNLFTRLRSPDQAVYLTLLSSSIVVLWYPVSMSRTVWRLLRWTTGMELDWPEYAAQKGEELYLRNLSENVTMIAFLGWLSILHWGPNQAVYPFFAFDGRVDPYTFRLTFTASLVIYAAELVSSWLARIVCWVAYGVDVTNLGLNQFREHPELVIACIFTSCHVLSDMLLFLVKIR